MAENETIFEEVTPASKRKRGSHPPKLNLAEAGAIIIELYERAGGEAPLDELSEIVRNSPKSSAFAAKINALRNYNLVSLEGDKIVLSTIGEKIVAPKEKNEQTVALKTAFLEIEGFKTVYEKFVGKILPQDEFLKNSFNEYGRDLAEGWMEQFKVSADYAGLLLDRGDGKLQVRESGKAATVSPPAETSTKEAASETDDERPVKVEPLQRLDSDKNSYQFLIEILDADMDDAEQTAVWTLIRYLKKKESTRGASE